MDSNAVPTRRQQTVPTFIHSLLHNSMFSILPGTLYQLAFDELHLCLVVLFMTNSLVVITVTEGASHTNSPLNSTLLPFWFPYINWYRWLEILLKSDVLSQPSWSVITITVSSFYANHSPVATHTRSMYVPFLYCTFVICIFHDLQSSFLCFTVFRVLRLFSILGGHSPDSTSNYLFHQFWLLILQFPWFLDMHILFQGFHALFYALLIILFYNFRQF
jgi:hypothetical protein